MTHSMSSPADNLHPAIEAADSLILDIGNVLLDFIPRDILLALVPKPLRALFHREVFQSAEWILLDRGELDNRGAALRICRKDGMRPHFEAVLRLLDHFPRHMPPLPLTRMLTGFKAQGKKLYALSNFHQQAFDTVFALHPFFALMDGMVISAHEKTIKPEEKIYRLLLDRYGINPGQAVFIDDMESNIAAARHLGIGGIVYAGHASILGEPGRARAPGSFSGG